MSMTLLLAPTTDDTIDALLAEPETLEDFLEQAGDTLHLDKSWHILHFLLTGDAGAAAGPLGFLLGGGEALEDVDVGFAAARVFDAAEVAEIASALAALDWSDLLARWDTEAIRAAEIDAVDPDATLAEQQYAAGHHAQLQAFMRELAAAGLAMIVC